MKPLFTLLSVLLFSLVTFAGPTKKVIDCNNVDYTGIATAVDKALAEKGVRTNDADALEYIQGVLPQELGGFTCTKILYIEPVFGVPETTSAVYVLENYEFILQLVITTNKIVNEIVNEIESVNAELIDVKFY